MYPINLFIVKCFFLWLLLLGGTTAVLHGQVAGATSGANEKDTSYGMSYVYNATELLTAPLRWKRKDWKIAGGVTVLTGASVLFDNQLSTPFFSWKGKLGNKVGNWGDFAGDLAPQLGISALAVGYGLVAKNTKVKNFGLDNLQSQIYITGGTWLVKELAGRARPYTSNNPYHFFKSFGKPSYKSFYSGHTALAFGTVTMLFLHSKKKRWVGIAGYSFAALTGISRIQQREHWASDVLVGAVTGTLVSAFVYKQQEKRRNRRLLKVLP